MSNDLGSLTCRICGQTIYFPLAKETLQNDERLIELTCSRGHSDSYWDVMADHEPITAGAEPKMEMARAMAVGF